MRFLAGLACFCLLVAPAAAEAAQDNSAARVLSGYELMLSDGRILRLEGIEEPFAETREWRAKARQALENLIASRPIVLEDFSVDRYGRTAAQAYALDADGGKIWLQGELLKRGLAFLYPPTGMEERLNEMRALEAAARRTKTGVWADAAYADVPANGNAGQYGRFTFVSGKILDASRVKNMIYLHFGENWRRSLTIVVAAHDLRAFRDAGIDLLDLEGKTVSARGWVKRDIGLMITVTNPGQIEMLDSGHSAPEDQHSETKVP